MGLPAVHLGRLYTPVSGEGWVDIPMGALAVDRYGVIERVGTREDVGAAGEGCSEIDHGSALIVPGLIDCHQHLCHYQWTYLVRGLRQWLDRIYRLEIEFEDAVHAREIARRFYGCLVRNGTTTCCVHGPYFVTGTDAAFEAAAQTGLRVLMGMNAADRNLPEPLRRSPRQAIEDAVRLWAKWDNGGKGQLDYCFTVRPAYCASAELLHGMAQAATAHSARLQNHLAEDADMQREILRYFPGASGEVSVYERTGFLGPRTIMAHGIFLDDLEMDRLAYLGTSLIHCPRSNLLTSPRQMPLARLSRRGIAVGLGTDLGGGKGLSMFRVMEDAMKASRDISVHDALRLATIGGARALGLDSRIGTLEVGKEADFVVLRPKAFQERADAGLMDIEGALSSLVFNGDDRDVVAVYVNGAKLKGA